MRPRSAKREQWTRRRSWNCRLRAARLRITYGPAAPDHIRPRGSRTRVAARLRITCGRAAPDHVRPRGSGTRAAARLRIMYGRPHPDHKRPRGSGSRTAAWYQYAKQ